MKKFALAFWLLSCGAWAAAPVVSDVHGSQDAASGKVQVFYNLADSDTPKLQVTLQVSADAGVTWAVPVRTLDNTSGIGDEVTPGTGKLIVWDAKADWPGQISNKVRFKVNATDTPVPPAPAGMALIPAGSFQMGDALDGDILAPMHTVNLSTFYMEKYEVTKTLWDEVRAWGLNNGYTDLEVGAGMASDHPVQSITWYGMVKWCNARSEKAGLVPCYTLGGTTYKTGQSDSAACNFAASGYRLPTEAEWEKAARGELSGKRFPWGDTISHSQANYCSSTSYSYDVSPTRGYHPTYGTGSTPYTSPVGRFGANGYGLYDMAGNVYERCWDRMGGYGTGAVSDPTGPESGVGNRIERGGSWYRFARNCCVSNRSSDPPEYSSDRFGFRCARSSVPSGQ